MGGHTLIIACLLLSLTPATMQVLNCTSGQQPCGPSHCYDPNTQGCVDGNVTIECINSCNGTCYSNSQYCYNNIKVCSIGESVCNVTRSTWPNYIPTGLACYNPSYYICSNTTLCERYYSCGSQCLENYYAACANNQTICPGYEYYRTVKTCGSRNQCYDPANSTCLNGTTVCPLTHTRLCGTRCWDPNAATCVNGTILQCIRSCNGTCYSSSQYCHNNTKVCNVGESVCNAIRPTWPNYISSGWTCYNSSEYVCSNNTLCQTYSSCGSKCLETWYAACANNQTICSGYYYWISVKTCGNQQTCYDTSNSTCVNGTTLCPLGNQLCAGRCYNPQSQYCTGGNNTIYCLSNPSSPYCPSSTTTRSTTTTSTTPSSNTCCSNKNCTTNTDCCQSAQLECQCFRHLQNDTYGSCINPNILPICGDSCPVQSRCKIDSDCCKCQCGTITLSDADGNPITRKQCVQRSI